jgi:hypothetical protein
MQFALSRLDENPTLAHIWIHKPGPLTQDIDKLQQFAGVYQRGMSEVKTIVQSANTISRKA